MPTGAPDFWVVQLPAMPVIGEGQVAWFQSDTALVGAEDTEDLINYVVPDGMELHVCSGVVSCDFPRTQRYKLLATPAATWISPTSYIDPNDEWSHEEWVYDENIDTSGYGRAEATSWSSYLILLVNATYINKVKFQAQYLEGYVDKIDIDVYYEGDWHDVYEGAYVHREWVEKDIPDGTKLVSKARVRGYNPDDRWWWFYLYEFMFNTSGETPQEGIYFDTHSIIPYLPQAPYIVEAGATFTIRVYNDDDAAHNMSVSLAGFLQSKV